MEDRRSSDVQIEVLTERVENWMKTTTDYRLSLCQKLDRLQDRLDKLPCDVRCEETKSIKLQIKALWVIVTASLMGIISEWVKLK